MTFIDNGDDSGNNHYYYVDGEILSYEDFKKRKPLSAIETRIHSLSRFVFNKNGCDSFNKEIIYLKLKDGKYVAHRENGYARALFFNNKVVYKEHYIDGKKISEEEAYLYRHGLEILK
jgi:hypothetical protein